jgi:hypothetical protein
MASKNAERLKRYKARLRAAGFKRLSFWVCADLAAMLADERMPTECGGTLVYLCKRFPSAEPLSESHT